MSQPCVLLGMVDRVTLLAITPNRSNPTWDSRDQVHGGWNEPWYADELIIINGFLKLIIPVSLLVTYYCFNPRHYEMEGCSNGNLLVRSQVKHAGQGVTVLPHIRRETLQIGSGSLLRYGWHL